jgi:hypothetical protein
MHCVPAAAASVHFARARRWHSLNASCSACRSDGRSQTAE